MERHLGIFVLLTPSCKYILILGSSKEELDQICGRIVAGMVVISDRLMDKATPHDIDSEGYIRLTGPKYPLDGICDNMFYPRLFRKDKPGHFFHPHSGINFNKWGRPIGNVMIPALDRPGLYGKFLLSQRGKMNRLNELCSDVIHTTCGPVQVTHATFEDAADSFLMIKLNEWRGEGDAANVYGTIETSDTLMGDDDRARSVAFDLKRDECIRVKPEQYIRMHRPVTVVPMGHQLKVKVSLFHNDMSSERVVIADGVCLFTARSADTADLPMDAPPDPSSSEDEDTSSGDEDQFDGKDQAHQCVDKDKCEHELSNTGIISGEWGKIEIKVYWLPCWCRNYSQLEKEDDRPPFQPTEA